MMRGSGNDRLILFAIAQAAIVFSSIHFRWRGREGRPGDVMVNTYFRATDA